MAADTDHVLIYVNNDAGDLALRRLAWDLLARRWVVRATYLEGAELTVAASGEGDALPDRTLVLLCEASKVDVIFEHLGYAVRAVAVPTVRVTL